MAITTTAELGDTIPTILEEAQFTQQFKAVMQPLCWTIRKGKGSTINVPYFGEFTAAALTEGVDMTGSQTMVDTNVQITPVEVGLKGILTDSVIEDDNEDLKRAMGVLLGDGYEKKVDIDLLGQLGDAATSLGGTGTTLTMGHIAAARATLAGNITANGGPAPMPYVCVIHPFGELDLVDVVTPVLSAAGTSVSSYGGGFADEVLARYSIGRLFGIPIVIDGNIAVDSSSDCKGGVFASGKRGGIIFGFARMPTIEAERDASLRGWELNYVGRYGVGEFRSQWIVELYHNATAPA